MLVLFKGHIVLRLYFGSRDQPKVLSKTSQNIETDCSSFKNSNKRPFSCRFIVQPRSHAGENSALLLTPSKNPLQYKSADNMFHRFPLTVLHWSLKINHRNTIAPGL